MMNDPANFGDRRNDRAADVRPEIAYPFSGRMAGGPSVAGAGDVLQPKRLPAVPGVAGGGESLAT